MIRCGVLLCLPVCLLAAPASAQDTPPTGQRPVVSVITEQHAPRNLGYVGTVMAKVQVDLGFPMGGTVVERLVDRADVVDRGDVLARLDTEEIDANQRAAEAGVTVAVANLDTARDAKDRAAILVQRGVDPQKRLDDATRDVEAAQARLDQARATLVRAQDRKSLAALTAPQDAIVTEIYVEPGDTVSAGEPVLQLSGTAEREVVIDLRAEDAEVLAPGAEFTARLVSNPGVTARAQLDRIDPVAAETTRTRRAHLRLIAAPAGFRFGALADIAYSGKNSATLILPRSALLDATETGAAVWIVDRTDNTVHRTQVTLDGGTRDLAIVTAGVTAGDEVVIRGIHSLQDGQTVGPRIAE